MIVALILVNDPDKARYFASAGDESVIEHVTKTVLRGPFGGTLVAAHPALAAEIKTALHGFAVQQVDTPQPAVKAGPHSLFIEALKAADAFRARWERAMAAAAGRFESSGIAERKEAAGDWSKHKKNPDVKIRGLARSFERDGVLLCPGDFAEIKKERLAQMVEGFARDGQSAAPHPFAEAVSAGLRGWPVMLSLEGAREVAALPAETVLSDWLLKNVERVCDVKV